MREEEVLYSDAWFYGGSQWFTELCRLLPIPSLSVWLHHFIGLSLSFKNGEFEQKEAKLQVNVSLLSHILGL